jgi:hypothetical protein
LTLDRGVVTGNFQDSCIQLKSASGGELLNHKFLSQICCEILNTFADKATWYTLIVKKLQLIIKIMEILTD